eukprot:Skav219387  [mRNA]  locus=scaffold4607:69377:73226:- [translate_table: standard]
MGGASNEQAQTFLGEAKNNLQRGVSETSSMMQKVWKSRRLRWLLALLAPVIAEGHSEWHNVSPTNSPGTRYGTTAVWSASSQRMYIFGGTDGSRGPQRVSSSFVSNTSGNSSAQPSPGIYGELSDFKYYEEASFVYLSVFGSSSLFPQRFGTPPKLRSSGMMWLPMLLSWCVCKDCYWV